MINLGAVNVNVGGRIILSEDLRLNEPGQNDASRPASPGKTRQRPLLLSGPCEDYGNVVSLFSNLIRECNQVLLPLPFRKLADHKQHMMVIWDSMLRTHSCA